MKEAAKIAVRLPADVVRALTEPGAPIPDSLWFGNWSHLRRWVGPTKWTWSPLGEAVRDYLRRSQ